MPRDQRNPEKNTENTENNYKDPESDTDDIYIEKKINDKPKKELTPKQIENLAKMREAKKIKTMAKKLIKEQEDKPEKQIKQKTIKNKNEDYENEPIHYAPKHREINGELIEKIDLLTDYITYKLHKKELKNKKKQEPIFYEDDYEEEQYYKPTSRNNYFNR